MRKRLLILGLLLATAGSVATSASSDPNIDSWPYTHTSCPGSISSRVDPINFALYDYGTIGRVTNQVTFHASWIQLGGTTQYFGEHHNGGCYSQDTQQADGNVWNTRNHIRYHHLTQQDPSYFDVTVGDAHHEDFVFYCGHAVDQNGPDGSGFDQGRRTLRKKMQAGGHYWWKTWWGNTQQFTQCDGGVASSDGYTVFVQIHSWNH